MDAAAARTARVERLAKPEPSEPEPEPPPESEPAEPALELPAAAEPPRDRAAGGLVTAPSTARQTRALLLLSAGIFGVLSIWYVGSAVLPLMRNDPTLRPNGLTNAEGSLLTGATNVGFVVGCIGSALINLSDIVHPTVLCLVGALSAAVVTALSCVPGVSFELVLASRSVVGVCIALVYPPSMKLLGTWYAAEKRGAAIGVLFAFFCVGSAFPQLIKALDTSDGGSAASSDDPDRLMGSWRFPLLVTSGITAAAGLLVFVGVSEGPYPFPPAKQVKLSQTLDVLRTPSVLLPILGYTGHQIEVMNMWGWLAHFLVEVHGLSPKSAGLLSFAAISMGGPGSWAGGWLGDKLGRAEVCTAALLVSGSCSLGVGLLADAPLGVTVVIVMIWGFSVLVDSPNFPAIISKNADQEYVGTALSVQLASGYLMCTISMYLMAVIGDSGIGWRWTYPIMSASPLGLGVVAMQLLQRRETHDAEAEVASSKP